MTNNDYHCTITVLTSAQEALKKISQVNLWWKKDFSGHADKLHDQFRVGFGEPAFVDFVISEWVPNKKTVWSVRDCYLPWFNDKQEWNNTAIVFELSEGDTETIIKVTHLGLTPDRECYSVCEKGWNDYITINLANHISGGQAMAEQL